MKRPISAAMLCASIVAALSLAGCASSGDKKEIEVREQAEAPTGSNLPRSKDRATTVSGDQARDAINRGGSNPLPRSPGAP